MTTAYPRKQWVIDETVLRGLAIRLDMLETHYRKPKDLNVANLNRAAKTLRRWLSIAVPGKDDVPLPVIEALCDDLNTPLAITEMHRLSKTDPQGLFAAMRFMGLIPGEGAAIDYGMALEIKTIPIDHLPLPQWKDLP